MQKNIINILNEKDFMYVCDVIHDAEIKEQNIVYDKAKHTLDITLKRDAWEEFPTKTIWKFFIFQIMALPSLTSKLYLENVALFEVQTTDKTLKKHSFSECYKDNVRDEYILTFSEVLSIRIKFNTVCLLTFLET